MFEIAILSIYNGNGRRVDGHCCSGSDEPCSGECRTFVTACLLQQTTVVPEVPDSNTEWTASIELSWEV
jgi:hypothetical protein